MFKKLISVVLCVIIILFVVFTMTTTISDSDTLNSNSSTEGNSSIKCLTNGVEKPVNLFCDNIELVSLNEDKDTTLDDAQNLIHEAANILRDNGYTNTDLVNQLSDIYMSIEFEENKELYKSVASDELIIILAKIVFNEARDLPKMEQSAVIWCILNRVDAGYGSIEETALSPNQFAYSSNAVVREDIVELVKDVLNRWCLEKQGFSDIGRTLPSQYLYFSGDGKHNYFRDAYQGGSTYDWSLGSPYND